ncbi:MAG: xanthine dehydrogenase family protein molybdopterin-binding subunit [Alphaproteobacteria bacterium]|jgi:xanthine dehydrogenase molybdenum-binding subunit|nr:xanthine dehydrogenase family protein molybdopterin-binding subunit [Alphaproteobacteria bacterium]
MAMPSEIAKTTVIGERVTKPDAPDKAIGRTRYINDMELPLMLTAKILHADRPHARIRGIDVTRARALPGVHAVLTGDDVPELRFGISKDNLPLKGGKVRCIRDEIAAVAAESAAICDQALALIEVDYEDLPGVFSVDEALAEDAPLVHEDRPGNLSLAYKFDHGDIDVAEAGSDVVLETTFDVHYVTHCCMGPSCAIADFDADGKLTIYSQTQYPYNFKMDIAPALGIHPGDIRVVQPPVGGAFGSKLDVYPFEPIAVLLAKATRRPVKLLFDREEEFVNAPTRQPAEITLRTGAKRGGTLTFRDVRARLNNGAYTSWGPTTPYVMMRTFSSHFRVPNVRFRSQAVYTNNPYAGSFRGYGNVQATYCTSVQMDMLAEALEIDLVSLCLKNAQTSGEVTPQGSRLADCAFAECLELAAEKSEFLAKQARYAAARDVPGRIKCGIGLASSIHNAGGAKIHRSDGCGTILKLDDYARCTLITGASEIGQGIDAVLCQIVSEELGIPPADITIVNNDSAIAPWDVGVHASRTTFIAGNSAKRAARAARDQILAAAAHQANVAAEALDLRQGYVVQTDNGVPVVELDRLLRQMHFQKDAELVMTTDYYEPPSEPEDENHVGDMSAAYSHAVHVAEVEVDTDTGEVRVARVTSAQDVGRVINRTGLEAQVEGGIVMGLGYALSEELQIVEGRVLNPSFRDYKLPMATEMPEFDLYFVESDSETGPMGAKGIAELPTIVIAPAIANAVHNATGLRFPAPPLTPEKVARAIWEQRQAGDASR